MSTPTMRTPRSPLVRSARRSAAVPGAPEAVSRTVMSRISRAMLLAWLCRGEEEGDAVPAGDLATVPPAEERLDRMPAEAPSDEGALRPAVDSVHAVFLGVGANGAFNRARRRHAVSACGSVP